MAKAKTGRPRSEKSRDAILDATHALLEETGGAGLSVEAVARRAGVGKPTIYRWWPSLADIVLDVLLRQVDADIPVPPFTTLRETLGRFLELSMRSLNRGNGVHLRYLMAKAQTDEGFRERFREHLALQRRAALGSILHSAADHGEFGSGQNLNILIDMVFGAMWYRLLMGCAPLDQAFARDLTAAVMGLTRATSA